MKNDNTCVKVIYPLSLKTASRKKVEWRCRDVSSCEHCRRIEASIIRSLFRKGEGDFYLIKDDHWDAHKKGISRKSDIGYVRLPQADGTSIVYTDTPPNSDYTIIKDVTDEDILRSRIDPDSNGRVSRSGVFAKSKKNDDEETIPVTIYLPYFRYTESRKVMPYTDQIKMVEVFAYRSSPYSNINKYNAEAHMRHVCNAIFEPTLIQFGDKVEPLVKIKEVNVPESYLSGWIAGSDIKSNRGKNRFGDKARNRLDEIIAGSPPKDTVQYCLDNNLILSSDYKDSEKEMRDMQKQMAQLMVATQ